MELENNQDLINFANSHFGGMSNDGEISFASLDKFEDFRKDQDFVVLLASTYIDEAANGRNGYFITEPEHLRYYYWYNHKGVRLCLFLLIWINMLLVFFEKPAVPGLLLPNWITMLVELLCMAGYFLRLYHALKFTPVQRHWKDRKIILVFICVLLTLIDMAIHTLLNQIGYGAYAVRWARVLRPVFMINFSESRQVRRTVRNIRRTLPEISNVLILFLLVIGLYSLLGLKLFEQRGLKDIYGQLYFTNYWDIYFNLYVLTTTANNPDIMIPAYNKNNWYSLFFNVFTIIAMYIFVSIFLAVVYKNYRSHLKNEVKASVYRKRRNMKSAFDCLKVKRCSRWVVTFERWKQLLHFMRPKMDPIQVVLFWRVLDDKEEQAIGFKNFSQFCDLLHIKMDKMSIKGHFFMRCFPTIYLSKASIFVQECVKHRFFIYFFDLVILVNAICIGLNEEKSETLFLTLFNLEIFLKVYTYGPIEFLRKIWNVFDACVIEAATVLYVLESLSEFVRYSQFILDFLLILRILRLIKIIGNVRRFEVIIKTIMQIGPAILTYGGIIFILYYVFALIGMEAFHGRILDYVDVENNSVLYYMCGNARLNGSEFVRLRYCEKNFNDILKSFNILFDLMVVNQWHVITDGFVRVSHKAARIYFFSFHLLCVIVVLNIFVAFILEAFMLQYSLSKGNYEVSLEKKIYEKGRASSEAGNMSINNDRTYLPQLDGDFNVQEYLNRSGLKFNLRKAQWKNAEHLLQEMFEDELDEKDLGPTELDNDAMEDAFENEEFTAARKTTFRNIDLV